MKSIIILSPKSSGSSALQELLCRFGGGKHVDRSRHAQYETLYWTKAASILGLPQVRLPDSEVPIPRRRAERDLRRLLTSNIPGFDPPADPVRLVYEGWRALCGHYADVFVEKSPHHLHQWSVLKLIATAANEIEDVDFKFIGLVRNPLDMLYSGWTRRRTLPETMQHHWQLAYENLSRWRDLVGERLIIVRYEDLSTLSTVKTLFDAVGLPVKPGADQFIHRSSRNKWKIDKRFGFQLDPAVAATAMSYGYRESELHNERSKSWRLYSLSTRFAYKTLTVPASIRKVVRRLI